VTALLVLSGVLELIGLICAAIGFRATWVEHGRGEKFIEPMLRPIASWARAAMSRVSALVRRPSKPVDLQINDALQIQVIEEVAITRTWNPPPDPTVDLTAYAGVVTERINDLHEMVQNQRHALAAEAKVRNGAIGKASAALSDEIADVRKLSARVAVGGLRLQVVGWVFLFFGIIFGTIANVMGS
jgi:hypothetical protein